MFLQKLVRGNNYQIFPWLLIEECVTLPLGGPPLNGREIDLPNRIIRHQQKEYSMSQFEVRILELLLSRPGQIISRATILEQV